MQYLKDSTGFVYAYDDDVEASQMRQGLTRMTPEEVQAHLNPVKALSEWAEFNQTRVNNEYVLRMGAVANPYPLHERESWPIQLSEAKELVRDGESAVTPWVDQCAIQRGIDRLELATRIMAKDVAYRKISGFLSGVRQWHEDCISNLLELGEECREELENYDVQQGWVPEQEPE